MYWIESSGGPLILIERELVSSWGGDNISENKYFASDYDRACSVDDYAAKISIASGSAVIIADEPCRTAIIQRSETECIVVRWKWALCEADIIEAVSKAEDQAFPNAEYFTIEFNSGKFIIFDAVLKGDEVMERLEGNLTPGIYKFFTRIVSSDENTCAILHRLVMYEI